MIVEGIEQHTPEWIQMRIGCVTASRMADVMAKLKKKDSEAQSRADYKGEIVCETLTGRASDHYVSPAMQWGIDNEIFARNAYEVEVAPTEFVGFALHDSIKKLGASPDGLVGDDGLVQFKCPNTSTHLEYVIAGVVPAEYHWQMLCEMACTGRDWCDFASYDPRLPKKLQLFVRRFERDDARIAQMEDETLKFLDEVEKLIAQVDEVTLIDTDPTLTTQLKESLRASLSLKG